MPCTDSVFHALLKLAPKAEFARLVAKHGADDGVRRLTCWMQFVALLHGQLSGSRSLREIVGGLESLAARLPELGGRAVARSTLADANARRPSAVFSDLFARLVLLVQDGLRRKMGEAVYLIDATSLRLSGMGSDWAHFSSKIKARGAKVHVIYDGDAQQPIYAAVTAAKVNDITAAQAMPIKAGATYVFDLGYYYYGWWATLDAAGCRIVTRFKSNTPLLVLEERPVPPESSVLSDRIGLLPPRQGNKRKNPMSRPVREVRVRTETGKELRILTNDLQASAQEIAALYKRRWAIELFFRWIKQTLQIRHLIGRSENAVRIQVAVTLIAYLLLHLAHAPQKARRSAAAFAHLVRINLMLPCRGGDLLGADPPRIPRSYRPRILRGGWSGF